MKNYRLPSKYKLRVRHYHNGNDEGGDIRKGIENEELNYPRARTILYATEAEVVDSTNNTVVANGLSICAPHDKPCRHLGYDIAVGRALREFDMEYAA